MPETGEYLILGLIAVAALVGLLVASVIVRYRNLQKDIELIQSLKDEESP